ncbi:MAG: hypothetical protein R6U98_31195, partial [Pirellulaceae bacterium]
FAMHPERPCDFERFEASKFNQNLFERIAAILRLYISTMKRKKIIPQTRETTLRPLRFRLLCLWLSERAVPEWVK